jgi:uncharacterized repeat protein (TIGR01451 family)
MKKTLLFLFSCLTFCFASAQISIVQPPNFEMCFNFNYTTFDLTTQTPVILGSLPPANYTVTYHTTSAGASTDTNAISNPSSYINASNPQVIYVRVEENANPANFAVTNFSLIIHLNPSVYAQNFTKCDLSGSPTDGLTLFDLEEIAEQVYWYSSIEPTEMEVTFYATQTDAQNQTNGLSSPFANTSASQVIYARCTYYDGGCTTIIPITLLTTDCTGQCIVPDDLAATNVTGTSATFSWTALGTETQWEILVLYAGGPFPLPTMDGIVVNTNPVALTGLECLEEYDVYVRAVCGTDISDWSPKITFATPNCGSSGGQPVNLTGCAQNGTACFDLTVNEANVLAGANPADYIITFHTSSADASTGTNPIAATTSYCIASATATTEIYMRVVNDITSDVEILAFTITPQDIVTSPTPLQAMVQCDEDGDGTVIFNLTAAQAQIGTTNALAYYTNFDDANAATNPISDPIAYGVNLQTALTTIYIRETVPGSCDIIHSMQVNALANCNFANVCSGANSLCNALGVPFANTVGIEAAEDGNDYGCLGNVPNPTWFYLPVSSAGTINLMIEQGSDVNITQADLDVDFIAYGPYTDPVSPCSGMLTENKIVDCSYSADSIEYPVIPNALPGQYYIIMTTNFSDEAGYIRISETGSSQGEIDCTGLRLNAFLDANGNGTKDAGENNFTLGQFHYQKNGDGQIHNITSPSGVHRIYDLNASNTYDLNYTINADYATYYGVAAAPYDDVSVVTGAGLQDYNFPVTVIQAYTDLAVAIVPDQAPRPGFAYANTIEYTNLGSQAVASGTVTFTKDPLLTITANSQTGAVPTANGFTYTFTNLQPFETRSITVTMQVPLIPTVQLGDLLTNTANIIPVTGDVAPENNASVSAQEVIGSFDPNDKMESRGDRILITDFTSNDYLYYTIRFENTGTASAINIRINDVLSDMLDETTVGMVSASHNYMLDRVDNRLTWRFENIILPPTIEDPTGSHGYVHFRVKPKPGYAVGDVISNTAGIFFDFNPAIVTNTFNSEFVQSLAMPSFSDGHFIIYPNPAKHNVTVSLGDTTENIAEISLYDMLGKKILMRKLAASAKSETLDVSGISAGVYVLEVTTASNTRSMKKLIIE